MFPRLRTHARRLLCSAAALLLALPLAGFAATAGTAPVEGVDYVVIPDGKPFAARPDRIEVVEVFGYTCPHCASFEPHLVAWERRLADDVELVRVPAPFGGHWMPYARAWYAAEAQGVAERVHQAVFDAIHEHQTLPASGVSDRELAAFYAARGADGARFLADLSSDGTRQKLVEARDFLMRSGVEGTPALVVNGRYRVTGRSIADILRTTDALVERERAGRR